MAFFIYNRVLSVSAVKMNIKTATFQEVHQDNPYRGGNYYDYKVIVSNKGESVKNVVLFHSGRGGQEDVFGDTRNDTALDEISTKKLAGIQIFTICVIMAHNLSCELQMITTLPAPGNTSDATGRL